MQKFLWGAALTVGIFVSPAGGQQALHCEDLNPTTPGDATRAFECVSELSAGLEAAMARIQALEEIAHEVPETRLVPKSAVLAFDAPDGCPEGWSHLAETQSRSIVGASRGAFAEGFADDEAGNPLTGYKYREHGGEVMVTLTPEQMPAHIHQIRTTEGPPPTGLGSGGFRYLLAGGPSDVGSEPAGDSQPHNNMPPYIALYFCKKD